ncbi:hypothetical protein CAAN1_19S02982 [[Candida] anglica]|uniref:WD40 repeat-like protein n=1 Tax=[Candida] anglica TaxID=148631 RepID=A0ABP0E5G5_9ASCO
MEWYNGRAKRSSESAGLYTAPNSDMTYTTPSRLTPLKFGNGGNYNYPLLPPSCGNSYYDVGGYTTSAGPRSTYSAESGSYYSSQSPLYCSDWVYFAGAETDCVALSSYKEDFTNKLQIVHGVSYSGDSREDSNADSVSMGSPGGPQSLESEDGFEFYKVAEIPTDYPITNLQWDPSIASGGNGNTERLAASSEVFRLYEVDHETLDRNNNFNISQTHILANNTNTTSACGSSNSGTVSATGNSWKNDSTTINTFPPVTSFDWNKKDPSIIITSSVDTTCTIWDLNRSHQLSTGLNTKTDTASVKTQLIAHDSEVFDVKFIHDSTNIFASVGNDGSIRVFDLRSLEHSTIIYEPPTTAPKSGSGVKSNNSSLQHNSHALLKLSTSNVDQHHLAAVGVNSNQVKIIDMRMPGIPVARLDGSFDGVNNAAINSIKWHPNSNFLLTGGDDCQALVWDCNSLPAVGAGSNEPAVIDVPVLGYEAESEVNNVSWRTGSGDWMGVVAGKGFQAVLL